MAIASSTSHNHFGGEFIVEADIQELERRIAPDAFSLNGLLTEGGALSPSLEVVDESEVTTDADSLRIQTAMQQESRLYSTVSNLLKKYSDTQSSIISNIK